MQVPECIVSFYVATCGQNGANLGSDEKEIILLVYVILDGATGEIIGTKQILVRPDGSFVKNRSISTSSDASTTTPSSPPLSIAHTDGNAGTITTTTISNTNNFNNNINTNSSNIINTNSCITNKDNQILCIPNTSTSGVNLTNIVNTASTTITNGLLIQTDNSEQLPIATAQAAGKPLNEAIEEFDLYLRSLSINENDIKLIADGQLPLRQCLHREACAKDLALPTIYNKFSDLRKEFLKFKSGDLSRALVPLKDVKKILQTPVAPLPQGIDEMLKDLNINSTEDNEFYVKESRDMVSVIQHMLKFGHKFMATELVNLDLEPGICSIDDEIDGNCIVRARGLPWQSSDQDIAKFFRGLNVAKGGVALCLSPLGRRNGEALIRFVSQEHRDMALKRHKHHIGPRYIEVYRATGEDFLSVAGGASNEAQAFLSKGAQVIIRMRGLPYDCTAKQVLDFFTTGENPCDVLDGTEGVLFVKKPDGRATGDAFVLFSCESDAPKALGRHRESIGQRYIELFRSTTAEVQQVLNRSMDPKTYEQNHQQPPLIAQLPTMQLSLLPQRLITSGTTKNCIRLRGLPYEALVEHILHFLDDFAKHIIYQGVHMVINAQGQPSGEAFIQMDTEESARLCAQLKHNRFMVFGKKYRYIEVFQCSGDDMNMVLNGGLQSPPIAAPHPHHPASAGKQTSLLSPGMLAQPPPTTAHAISSHTHAHAHATHNAHALQTPPNLSQSMASLTQPSHMSLAAAANQQTAVGFAAASAATAANSLPSFMSASGVASNAQHNSLVASQNALAVASGLGSASAQLGLPSSSGVASQPVGLPFNFSFPPSQAAAAAAANNSALIAQQQAQFIAQHNLLARQQAAAAVAVEQQQQQFYANFMNPIFFPHHSATAATFSSPMLGSTSAAGQPQFMFMPRPYLQPLPMGYALPPQGYQFATTSAASPSAAATAAGMHASSAAAAAAAAAAMPQNMKRSYENAFQQDANAAAATAAKRALTRPQPGSFYQFYNPGV